MISPLGNNFGLLLLQRVNRLHLAALNQAMSRVATGERINSGADDPAGLIASEKLRASLQTLDAEARSLQRTGHIAQTADGALAPVSELLRELDGLVMAGANDAALSPEEQVANQLQIDSILDSINRISETTEFNGTRLLDGTMTLSAAGHEVAIDNLATSSLGPTQIGGQSYALADLRSGGSLAGQSVQAAEVVAAATGQISMLRGRLGALQKETIEPRLGSIATAIGNTLDSASQIRDSDLAAETSQQIRLTMLKKATLQLIAEEERTRGTVLNLLSRLDSPS